MNAYMGISGNDTHMSSTDERHVRRYVLLPLTSHKSPPPRALSSAAVVRRRPSSPPPLSPLHLIHPPPLSSAMLPTSRSGSNGGCGNAAKATGRAEAAAQEAGRVWPTSSATTTTTAAIDTAALEEDNRAHVADVLTSE